MIPLHVNYDWSESAPFAGVGRKREIWFAESFSLRTSKNINERKRKYGVAKQTTDKWLQSEVG